YASAFDSTAKSITISRRDRRQVTASLAISTQGATASTVAAPQVMVGLGGAPAMGEVWTLTLDGTAHSYTAAFRDDLATIASKLATGIDLTRYDVVVQGRSITLDRVDGSAPVAAVAISVDSKGGAGVSPQLVFTSTTWSAEHGERPRFDPRMNDSTSSLQLLNGPAAGNAIDVSAVAKDILSFANSTAFKVALLRNGSAANLQNGVQFIGTPDPSSLPTVDWASAMVALSGLAAYGETWTLTLDGVAHSVNVTDPNGDVASHIAQLLTNQIAASSANYDIERRTGLLGDARILIKRRLDGQPFRVTFSISSGSEGRAVIS